MIVNSNVLSHRIDQLHVEPDGDRSGEVIEDRDPTSLPTTHITLKFLLTCLTVSHPTHPTSSRATRQVTEFFCWL